MTLFSHNTILAPLVQLDDRMDQCKHSCDVPLSAKNETMNATESCMIAFHKKVQRASSITTLLHQYKDPHAYLDKDKTETMFSIQNLHSFQPYMLLKELMTDRGAYAVVFSRKKQSSDHHEQDQIERSLCA